MAYTQADLDALNAAIAQGALRVKYSDKEVEYRSLPEMLQIRDLILGELGQRRTPKVWQGYVTGT